MRIGIVTDLHYCSQESLPGGRRPQLALVRLRQALEDFARADAQLLVCLGDLINQEPSHAQNVENLGAIAQALQAPGIPCVCVMGNHDCEAFTPQEFARISGLWIPPLTLTEGGLRLHFLNANHYWDGSAYQPGHSDWVQALVPPQALDALAQSLDAPGLRHFVFVHQCLDPFVEHRHIIGNSKEIRAVLEAAGVRAVFQGHYHPGARNWVEGIPYVTLPALCEAEGAFLLDTEDF